MRFKYTAMLVLVLITTICCGGEELRSPIDSGVNIDDAGVDAGYCNVLNTPAPPGPVNWYITWISIKI